jgi:hypothetical protein
MFVVLNPGALRARERSAAELDAWVRRDEEDATLRRCPWEQQASSPRTVTCYCLALTPVIVRQLLCSPTGC